VLAQYASALLAPVPGSSVLVTSYDMQWTALRYLTACEGHTVHMGRYGLAAGAIINLDGGKGQWMSSCSRAGRPQLLNAPMMTFHWHRHYRPSYSRLAHPGLHLCKPLTAHHRDGGFALEDLVEASFVAAAAESTAAAR